jgi:hypothetical protein
MRVDKNWSRKVIYQDISETFRRNKWPSSEGFQGVLERDLKGARTVETDVIVSSPISGTQSLSARIQKICGELPILAPISAV